MPCSREKASRPRSAGAIDIQELIVFLTVGSEEAASAVVSSHRDPALRGPYLWGRQRWRAQQCCNESKRSLSLQSRRRGRAVLHHPGSRNALHELAVVVVGRCGSMEAASRALDVFKNGTVTLGDLQRFLEVTLSLSNCDRLAATAFRALDVDQDGVVSVENLTAAVKAHLKTT
eukprot:TRINITY_DN46093_c0_g1_i1.p1 TRINITY_DN46093_c0_g1~~TRINITY_DN46093_c0_g1_i1.p1  ORF type:complete len:174 (+),score=28.45 TRINITY_DN46093_c0_g1_i1:275-796(+)